MRRRIQCETTILMESLSRLPHMWDKPNLYLPGPIGPLQGPRRKNSLLNTRLPVTLPRKGPKLKARQGNNHTVWAPNSICECCPAQPRLG